MTEKGEMDPKTKKLIGISDDTALENRSDIAEESNSLTDTDCNKDAMLQHERCRILKNLAVICLAFVLNFTAFQGLQNLQSSLNRVEGLGTISLSVIYAGQLLGAIFLTPPTLGKFRLG